MNKLDELDIMLKSGEFNFVFITESWAKPFHADSFILSGNNNYCIFRYDRPATKGAGGVCMICKNDYAAKVLTIPLNLSSLDDVEILAFDL